MDHAKENSYSLRAHACGRITDLYCKGILLAENTELHKCTLWRYRVPMTVKYGSIGIPCVTL